MSGPINIASESEWSSLLSGTNVVIADCTFEHSANTHMITNTTSTKSTPTGVVPAR